MKTQPASVSAAILRALEAHPAGLVVAEIAELMGKPYNNVGACIGNLNESRSIAWLREPAKHAPHRCRYFALAHAAGRAQMGPPGLVPAKGRKDAPKVLKTEASGPVDMSRAKVIRAPGLPEQPPPPRVVNPNECRPWANVAAMARASA